MLPLMVGPALYELLGAAPGSDLFNLWIGRLFLHPRYHPTTVVQGILGGRVVDADGKGPGAPKLRENCCRKARKVSPAAAS